MDPLDEQSKYFSDLSLRALACFTSLADLEQAGDAWAAKVHETLSLFSKLWKYQLDNREALIRSGVTPRSIGDIALRIAQLYFGLYMNSSSCQHLFAASTWLEGILARGYFNEDDQVQGHVTLALSRQHGNESSHQGSMTGSIVKKRLRAYARFILALLFLDRREESWNLLLEIEALVASTLSLPTASDATLSREAIALVREISSFLSADIGMPVPISPGSQLIFRPNLRCPHPSSDNPLFSNHVQRLKDVVLVASLEGQLKIAELSLDSYRMMLTLEWRDERFSRSSVSEASTSIDLTVVSDPSSRDLDVPNHAPKRHQVHHQGPLSIIRLLSSLLSPPPSPQIASNPSSTSKQPDILLLHLVGKGHWGNLHAPISIPSTSTSTLLPLIDSLSIDEAKPRVPLPAPNMVRLPLGVFVTPSYENPSSAHISDSLITPEDLFPFTRRRILLIVDSDASSAFLSPTFVRGCSSCPPMCLLAPSHRPSAFLSPAATGSLFTLGLTCPLMAFSLMMGEKRPIESAKILLNLEAEIEKAESMIAEALTGPLSSLNSPWAAAWEDVLTRRLLARFTLLRSALHLHAATKGRSDCQCICSPTLPSIVNPGSSLCKELVYSISSVIEGRQKLFGF